MYKMKIFTKKTWIVGAAAALIVGSTLVMAYALNNSIPDNAQASVTSSVNTVSESRQLQTAATQTPTGYTVVDWSKIAVNTDEFKQQLCKEAGVPVEKAEEFYKEVIAKTTPGEKDMTAEQAAAYCADILTKAYGVDLTGYAAEATFSKALVPDADSWNVIFRASYGSDDTFQYNVSVNSVSGAMISAYFFDFYSGESHNTDLGSPDWIAAAEKGISGLLPENVTITGSSVVSATEDTGLIVVSTLSDGSACAVLLTGENKDIFGYINFPNGYDGSLDYEARFIEGDVG